MGRYRRPILVLMPIAIACVAMALAYFERQRRVEELVRIISAMPVGISAAEAERLIGRPPDETWQQPGVVVNYFTIADPASPLAAGCDEPQQYDVRLWSCGPLTIGVWSDEAERVVVRSGWYRPRHSSALLTSLIRLIRRLL